MPIDFQTIMLPLLKHCEDGQEHAFRIDYDLGVPTFATYALRKVDHDYFGE
jgi:restriction endonuclease Mrr